MSKEKKKKKEVIEGIIKRERSGVELWEPKETAKPDTKPSSKEKK